MTIPLAIEALVADVVPDATPRTPPFSVAMADLSAGRRAMLGSLLPKLKPRDCGLPPLATTSGGPGSFPSHCRAELVGRYLLPAPFTTT